MSGREQKADSRLVHHTLYQLDAGAAVTTAALIMDNLVTGTGITANPCMPRAAKLVKVAVAALTLANTVAGNWTLRIRKNESGSDSATFSFAVATGTAAKTAGNWSADAVWQAGDTYHMLADGPQKNAIAIRVTIEWEVL